MWEGEKKADLLTIHSDKKHFIRNPIDDKPILKKLSVILNQADYCVAHYGSRFDRNFINTRLEYHNLPRLKPTPLYDTWIILRKQFLLHSNKLDTALKFFHSPVQKLDLTYDEWSLTTAGHIPSLNKLAEHCRNDVLSLHWLWVEHLKKYQRGLMSRSMFAGEERKCSFCGEHRLLSWGKCYFGGKFRQRYRCASCFGWNYRPMKSFMMRADT